MGNKYISPLQRDTALITIEQKSRMIVQDAGNNHIILFGTGYFDFDPPYRSPLNRPRGKTREINDPLEEVARNSTNLHDLAVFELSRLRAESPIEINYDSRTSIGPPTLIGEIDDIELMGSLMQKHAGNYVYGGDFISGFIDDGICLYRKVLVLHSMVRAELEESIREELEKRLDEFELTLE